MILSGVLPHVLRIQERDFQGKKQLLQNTYIEIPKKNNRSENVVCNLKSPLLEGLNKLDMMYMVDSAIHIKVRKQENKNWTIDSCVTEISKDNKYTYSYLASIQDKERITIYCQLPVTNGDDPRCSVLLENLIELANKIADSQKSSTNLHSERR